MNSVCHYIKHTNMMLEHYTYFKHDMAEQDEEYYVGGNVSVNNHIVRKLNEYFKNDITIVDINDEIGLVSFFYKNRYGYVCEIKNNWFINLYMVI